MVEEIAKYRLKGVAIAFVLIEKFSSEIKLNVNNPYLQLVQIWHEIENFNNFVKTLQAPDFITIDLNDLVCSGKENPCINKILNSRPNGVEYTG